MKPKQQYITATTSISADLEKDLEFFTITPHLRQVRQQDGSERLQQMWRGSLGSEDWRYVAYINLRDE